jgi:hypothetical protein
MVFPDRFDNRKFDTKCTRVLVSYHMRGFFLLVGSGLPGPMCKGNLAIECCGYACADGFVWCGEFRSYPETTTDSGNGRTACSTA